MTEISVKTILDSLVSPDDTPVPAEYLPTVNELLNTHDNPALLEAINKVKTFSYGSAEDAEKN